MNFDQILVQSWPNLGLHFEFWSNFDQILVQIWLHLGPIFVIFCTFFISVIFLSIYPILALFFITNLGPILVHFGQFLVKFWPNFLITFLLNFPHCPILAQFVPILVTNFSRILSQFLATFLSNFGPIFWLPSCQIFLEFWLHFGPIFGYILVKFSPNFVRKLVTISSKIPNPASSQSQLQRSTKK